eukprot:31157-Pelagococcus_subviridis.AAC.25
MRNACHTEKNAMSTTNANDTRSDVMSSPRNAALCARSPPTSGSAHSAHHTDKTPTSSPLAPNALDNNPFSAFVTSTGPSVVVNFVRSHAAGAGVANRCAMNGSINAFVRNIAPPHTFVVSMSRPFRSIRSGGRSMKINASAKLNTPRVTGCTCGAAPRRSTPNLFSSGKTKKKSVDSAMTSFNVSGATAHAGSPGRPCHPGGDRRRTNQYAAPIAARVAATGMFASVVVAAAAAASAAALSAAAVAAVASPPPPPAALFSFSFFSCSFTSGATSRMIENDTSPSFSGDSTTSRAYASLPVVSEIRYRLAPRAFGNGSPSSSTYHVIPTDFPPPSVHSSIMNSMSSGIPSQLSSKSFFTAAFPLNGVGKLKSSYKMSSSTNSSAAATSLRLIASYIPRTTVSAVGVDALAIVEERREGAAADARPTDAEDR